MYEKMLAALKALPFTVKALFPAEMETALKDQAREIDLLRADVRFLRSQIVERK